MFLYYVIAIGLILLDLVGLLVVAALFMLKSYFIISDYGKRSQMRR
jgi:hypothetical protein